MPSNRSMTSRPHSTFRLRPAALPPTFLSMTDRRITIEFNDRIVRQFVLATVIWGAVGMLVGLLVASQLSQWRFNFNLPWLTFGRLRPLHTNAVIFAFVGN